MDETIQQCERQQLLSSLNFEAQGDNVEVASPQYQSVSIWSQLNKQYTEDSVSGKPGLGIVFFKRLWKVITVIRAYQIVFVALLSLGEAYFISRVGKIQGQFYSVYLRNDQVEFGKIIGMSILTYLGALACSSAAEWLSQFLSVKWRSKLGRHMHKLYCQKMKFYWLKNSNVLIDNPDQRLTDDLKQLCDVLGELTYKLSAVPFNLILYAYLVVSIYANWIPVLIATAFCILGLIIQRTVMVKLAKLVFQQEQLEGDFRKGHMRLRDEGESIAMHKDWRLELQYIDARLNSTLKNQYKIVMWRWLLIVITKGLEYSGSTLNFVIVGIGVFGGVWAAFDNAELAQHISNASFYTLTFIYTFTCLLDAADNTSKMAGLLARVTQLMEHLQNIHISNASQIRWSQDTQDQGSTRSQVVGCDEEYSAWHYKTQSLELMSAFSVEWNSAFEMEISVHSLGQDALLQEVQKCFPDAPANSGLLAVVTMQKGKVQHMDQMLNNFLQWEATMSTSLDMFWCNAVYPCNGLALHGQKGKRYSEVFGAQVLLGYNKVRVDGFDMLQHPSYGCDVYPASFFTNAPLPVLKRVLYSTGNLIPSPVSSSASDPQHLALLLQNITLYTPSQKLALKNLDLSISRGSSLLITGPSGSGKTTFVKALCDLWNFHTGRAIFLPKMVGQQLVSGAGKEDVAFVPQICVCAPGGSLRDQLIYPRSTLNTTTENAVLRRVLKVVHLEYLLEQVDGDFDANQDWMGMLSPGEWQKISIARILLLKPTVAVMDEATCALPQVTENQLITKIQSEGITMIYIGHRSSLDKYFEFKLSLNDDGEGRWSLIANQDLLPQS